MLSILCAGMIYDAVDSVYVLECYVMFLILCEFLNDMGC